MYIKCLLIVLVNLAKNWVSFPVLLWFCHNHMIHWNRLYFFTSWLVPLLWQAGATLFNWNSHKIMQLKPLERFDKANNMGTMSINTEIKFKRLASWLKTYNINIQFTSLIFLYSRPTCFIFRAILFVYIFFFCKAHCALK